MENISKKGKPQAQILEEASKGFKLYYKNRRWAAIYLYANNN